MKEIVVLAEFNTKSDGDEGYGEYVSLKMIAEVIQFQNEKHRGKNVFIRLSGDELQICKYN